MQKTIITGAIVVLGLIGLMLWGRNSPTTRVSQGLETGSSLAASEKIYDFGTISMKNGLVNHIFKVTNSSDKDIYVEKVSTSCMCTSAFIVGLDESIKGPFSMPGMGYVPPANETVKVGESRDIKVVYDPNAHGPSGVGRIDRFIALTDSFGGTLQLEIKANVTP